MIEYFSTRALPGDLDPRPGGRAGLRHRADRTGRKPSGPSPGSRRVSRPGRALFAAARCAPSLRRLHDWLLGPIAERLPADPAAALTIVAHGQLQRLSFAALPFGDGPEDWEVFRHALLYLPSLEVLEDAPQRLRPVPSSNWPLSSIPIPCHRTKWPLGTIHGPVEMGARLAGLFGPTAAQAARPASQTSFQQEAGAAKVLFLATHAFAESSPPRTTAVLLEENAMNDGYLVPEELEKLALAAELVVLTACASGRGELSVSRVHGLARLLLRGRGPAAAGDLVGSAGDRRPPASHSISWSPGTKATALPRRCAGPSPGRPGSTRTSRACGPAWCHEMSPITSTRRRNMPVESVGEPLPESSWRCSRQPLAAAHGAARRAGLDSAGNNEASLPR